MRSLKVEKISKVYGNNQGIVDFEMTMEPGAITLLLGPNGAGKTTAMNVILDLIQSKDRHISVGGKNMTESHKEWMYHVGAMISKPMAYPYMSAYDQLMMYAGFYENVNEERVQEVLELVGLSEYSHKKARTFSNGMLQRLDFARAILHRPEFLFLDEPFNGMDIEMKAFMKRMLVSMVKEDKTSILISSHMLGDIENIADRLIILSASRIAYNGLVQEAIDNYGSLEAFYLDKIGNKQLIGNGRENIWKSFAQNS